MPHRPHLDRVWTVLDLVTWGTEYFSSKGIESPRLTMELLLCDVLECTRVKLYSEFERPVLPDELSRLRGYVSRRAHHEPLQYITGTAWFYSLPFEVSPEVLIPRQETELITDSAIKWCRTRGAEHLTGLDVGTGSGCIPISIAHHVPQSSWVGIDISKGALGVAEANASRHNLNDRVEFQLINFLRELPSGTFDLVTMNPPYIPQAEVPTLEAEVRDFEPHRALTDDADGTTFYRRFAEVMPTVLSPSGVAFLELGWQGAEKVIPLFLQIAAVEVVDDLQGIPRVLVLRPTL